VALDLGSSSLTVTKGARRKNAHARRHGSWSAFLFAPNPKTRGGDCSGAWSAKLCPVLVGLYIGGNCPVGQYLWSPWTAASVVRIARAMPPVQCGRSNNSSAATNHAAAGDQVGRDRRQPLSAMRRANSRWACRSPTAPWMTTTASRSPAPEGISSTASMVPLGVSILTSAKNPRLSIRID
jgi:hypothetical protein